MKKVFTVSIALVWSLLATAQNYVPGVVHLRALQASAIPETDPSGAQYSFPVAGLQQFFDNYDSITFQQLFPSIKYFKQYPQAESLARVYEVHCACNAAQLAQAIQDSLPTYYDRVAQVPIGVLTHTPNDYDRNGQDPLTELELINAPGAWALVQSHPKIKLALFDTRYNTEHEDLEDNIEYHDGINSKDPDAHGTRVAGVAGAVTNNDIGMASAGYNTPLLLYGGKVSIGNQDALLDAVRRGARVVSNSMAFYIHSPSTQEMIDMLHEAGVVFVASAGNGSRWEYEKFGGINKSILDANPDLQSAMDNCDHTFIRNWLQQHNNSTEIDGIPIGDGRIPNYPASYNHVISVSSVGHLFARNSNHADNWEDVVEHVIGDACSAHSHNEFVDVCAPGYNIFVTIGDNEYGSGDGTSYSAPMTAAVCALILSANPCLEPDEVETILKSTAVDIYGIPENQAYIGLMGAGRIDAQAAVSLAQSYGWPTTTIASGETPVWTNDQLLLGDIIVESGAHLTIKGRVRMPEGGRIVVQRGGELTVDGGTLTTTCHEAMWQGIEVWGSPGVNQLQPGAQGRVHVLNGAVIEHAVIGISTSRKDANGYVWSHTGGGIIQAFNSTFRNNLRAVEYMSFHNPLNPSGTEPNNLGVFERCTFEQTDYLKDPAYTINEHRIAAPSQVSLWDVYGVRFRGCTFANRDTDHDLFPYDGINFRSYRGGGLYSVDADYRIEPWTDIECAGCPPQPTEFENLAMGIEAYTTNALRHVIAKGCTFHNVSRGIQLVGGSHDRVEDNTFIVDTDFEAEPTFEGIVVSHSDGYRITGNHLENRLPAGYGVARYGLRVDTTGIFSGQVYKNTVTGVQQLGFRYGLWTEGDNHRLKLECNTFDYGIRDWVSHEKDDEATIAMPQGICDPSDQGQKQSAGNNFDFTCGPEEHILMAINPLRHKSEKLLYTYSPNESRPPQQNCVTPLRVDRSDCNGLAKVHPCLVLNNPNSNILWLDRAVLAEEQDQRGQRIDGGSTTTLITYIQQVSLSSPALRDTLLTHSPYLSDTVLTEAINRIPVMADIDLYTVLQLNQPLTEVVWSTLTQRSPALDDSLQTLLAAGQNGLSDRALLESALAYGWRDYHLNTGDLLRYYLEQGRPDSLQVVLTADTTQASAWRLVRLYSETGQATAATQLMHPWLEGTAEEQALAQLEQLYLNLHSAGHNWFQASPAQKSQLHTLARGGTHAGVLAQAVLTLVDSARFWRPAPEENGNSGASAPAPTVGFLEVHTQGQAHLTARPNPFVETTRLDYWIAPQLKGTFVIEIYDLSSGQVLQSYPVQPGEGRVDVGAALPAAGLLVAALKQNDNTLALVRLVKQ